MEEYLPELTFDIRAPHFYYILEGKKTHEGRSAESRMAKTVKNGSIVKIVNPETREWYFAWYMDKKKHGSVKEMLECPQHPLSDMLPGIATIEEGVKIYQSFNVDPEAVNKDYYAIHLVPCSKLHAKLTNTSLL